MTEITSRFFSLAEMQAAHDELLDRREGLLDAAAVSFWPEVSAFVRHGVATGAILDASRDRRGAQSILDYWANALYRAGQLAPEARLSDFDPGLAPELPDEPCPYRGLAAFAEQDQEFFFGRDRLLNEMLERLRDGARLLAVVGSSGSGKSSVVLAGLLPRLKGGALPGSEGWRYMTIVPGSQPLASLARALQTAGEAEAGLDIALFRRLLVAAEGFAYDPDHLATILGETGSAPLALVVDQFEELFTLCTDDAARAAFVGQLLGLVAATESRHRVILTMRADFVDNVARLPELYPLFRAARMDMEALGINELRVAIEGPAARVGLKFEKGIVDDLISTILGERADLPLLQCTLVRLWDRRQRNRVTREVYQEVGNPREALERSAESLYNSLIPEEQEIAKRILLRMVRPGEGREVTSNRIRRDEVFRAGETRVRVERVLDRLIDEVRLVKLIEGETAADAQIEVAHGVLVRNWPRLVGWLDEEREGLHRMQRPTKATILPLRDRVQAWADRRFFREKHDWSEMLQRLSRTVASVLDLRKVTEIILYDVLQTMHISSGAFLIRRDEDGTYRVQTYRGDPPIPQDLSLFRADSPVISWLSHNQTSLSRRVLDTDPSFIGLWSREREDIRRIKAELFVPLLVRRQLIGILVLGPKLSETPYSFEEQQILDTLANQTAVAIENASLFSETLAEQERTATIVEQAFAGIILLDGNLRITGLNPAAEAITGLPAEQITGRPLSDIFGPGSRATAALSVKRCSPVSV